MCPGGIVGVEGTAALQADACILQLRHSHVDAGDTSRLAVGQVPSQRLCRQAERQAHNA